MNGILKDMKYYHGLMLVIIGLAFFHMLNFTTVVDDAFISLRVAKHWVESGLPFYNIEQREWVPSNFLWTLLIALGHKITQISLPLLSQLLGGLSGLIIIYFLYLLNLIERKSVWRITAPLLCAGSSVWAAWPLSGLETSFFTCLLTGSILLIIKYFKDNKKASLIFASIVLGLATLTRWETLLIFAITVLFIIFTKKKWQPLFLFISLYSITILPGIIYLLISFGTILPSSYFVKVHGIENIAIGKAYVKSFITSYYLIWFSPFLLASVIVGDKLKRVAIVYLAMIILVWSTYVMIIGGDFTPYHRFLAPVFPMLCVWYAYGINVVLDSITKIWCKQKNLIYSAGFLLIIIMLFTFGAPSFQGHELKLIRDWSKEDKNRVLIGQWMASHYNSSHWIAVRPAGIIPFYSEMNAMDFYCLTNREAAQKGQFTKHHWVGHQIVNVDWILSKKPKVIIIDEHLYEKDHIPNEENIDGVIENQWRKNPLHKKYQAKQVEIFSHHWLKYFERI